MPDSSRFSPERPKGFAIAWSRSAGVYDFVGRVHDLASIFICWPMSRPSELAAYVNHTYFVNQLTEVLAGVLRAAGIGGPSRLDDLLDRYVIDHQWPARVARSLDEPLADRILDVVQKAKGPIPLAELPERIAGSDPNEVRTVVDKLVARLALVEDIRPVDVGTGGGLPARRARENDPRQHASRTPAAAAMRKPQRSRARRQPGRQRHPCGTPRGREPAAPSPTRSNLVPQGDRAFSDRPRSAGWVAAERHEMVRRRAAEPGDRLGATYFTWPSVEPEGKQIRLVLTPRGKNGFPAAPRRRPLEIYRLLSTFEPHRELYSPHLDLFSPGLNPWDFWGRPTCDFLGTHVVALKVESGKRLRTTGPRSPRTISRCERNWTRLWPC